MNTQQQKSGIWRYFPWSKTKPMDIGNDKIDEEKRKQESEQQLLNLRKKIFELNLKWTRIFNYNELLKNPETAENSISIVDRKQGKRKGLLETCHKKWIALRLGFGLYRQLEENPQIFYSSRQEFTSRIAELYPELEQQIGYLRFSLQNEVAEILSQLIKVINNPQLAESYIFTHYDDLMHRVDRMKNQKAANKLRRAIAIISNKETEEITRCMADIRGWNNRIVRDKKIGSFVGEYGIPFNVYLIIERSILFIGGGVSRYDGQGFLGFNMHFRDEDLVKQLRSTSEIRRLMTYVKELQFFATTSNAIKKSVETESNWKGFEEFYNNLDRGQNYIRMFEVTFGNARYAKILRDFKKQKHEAPVDWENELNILGEEIKQSYQFVVESAANAYLRIFEAAIKRLGQGKARTIDELKKLIIEGDETPKSKRQFLKILGRARKQLIRELETERAAFQSLMQDVLPLMPALDSRFKTALNVGEQVRRVADIRNILERYAQWGNFNMTHLRLLQQSEDRLESDNVVRALTASVGSFEKEAILASQGIDKQDEIDEMERSKDGMVLEAIKTLDEEIVPKLARCESHINSKLGGYTDKVEYYLRGNIQQQSSQSIKES